MRFSLTFFSLLGLLLFFLPGSAGAQQTAELSFQPGKMYEAAFFKVRPGKEQELQERYFSKALPLAMEYGMRALGTFSVQNVDNGPNDVAMWGFFEWPDEATKARFDADRKFRRLRPIRDSLVETLRIVELEVAEPTTVTLRSDRMYEFASLWMNRHNASHMQDYFAAAGPFVASKGVQFLGDFKVTGSPQDYQFLPDTVVFIEWPSKEVKQSWFDSEDFRRVGYHRALALDRLVVVESSFNFEGK